MKTLPIALLTTVLLCLGSHAQDTEKKAPATDKKPALDWQETEAGEAGEFAKKLEKASAAGEKWTKSPESIILEFVGPFVSPDGEKAAATRNIRIFTKGEELPKVLNIVLVDDGLFDDSIKTSATRLALARQEDGSWKLRKVYKAQVKWPEPGE